MARRLALVTLAVLLLSGTASAADISGTPGADVLAGTATADVIRGRGGRDRLSGLAGGDYLDGGAGADRVAAGGGDDRVTAWDGVRDAVSCGVGRDVAVVDTADAVATDCEAVSKQISADPYGNVTSQHQTQVEPDSFAFGNTIVTVFQTGRFFSGGASNIGFATSTDGGRTWTSGFLPSLTAHSSPPGRADRATDPVVAYDEAHGVWLVATLLLTPPLSSIAVSRSPDGINWSAPISVAPSPTRPPLSYDKEWIACDNGLSSRFRGSCYVSYVDFVRNGLSTQTSTDGGATWSPASTIPDTRFSSGPFPVVRPNGDLVVVFLDSDSIAAARSVDGGATFLAKVRISRLRFRRPPVLRAPPLPTADSDAGGRVYVAWADCGFRPGCGANDIVLAVSPDGATWTPPARVPTAPRGRVVDTVIPGLAVDPATQGASARVALVYYTLAPECGPATCRLGVGFIASGNGGAAWGLPHQLHAEPIAFTWLPDTSSGRMVGDYVSASFAAGRVVSVFTLAAPPGVRFRQAAFATSFALRSPVFLPRSRSSR